MDGSKAYKLPSDVVVAGLDDMACVIVYYPNQPEYRQALVGSLLHLGQWTAWERDGLKRGRIAADNWRRANDLTLECIEMSCFDEIVNAIKGLQTTVSVNCYCDYITIEPTEITPPAPIPGIGDVPTTYGETDTTGLSWVEYQQLICSQSHAYVDYLKAQNEHLTDILGLGILALGVVAALIAVVSGFGIPVLLTLGSAAVIFQALIASPGASVFAGVSDDFELARADIVNAIVCADGNLRDVIEAAINPTAYDLFYRWVDWEQATTILRAGEYEGQALEPLDPSAECECDSQYFQLIYHFEDDALPFTLTNTSYNATQQAVQARMDDTGGTPRFSITRNIINQELGRPDDALFDIVGITAKFRNSDTSACNFNDVSITVDTNPTTPQVEQGQLNGVGDFDILIMTLDPPLLYGSVNDLIQFDMPRPGGGNGCGNPAPTHVFTDYVIIVGRTLG